jgi:hypothetical protein
MLYVFKRKKDQPEGEKDNHQSVRTIKTYCIESIDHLERRYDEIKQLCEMFKARAYIHVQKQNHFDVSLNMMVELAQRIQNGQHNQKGLFDSVVGQVKTQEKRWIVDVDMKDEDALMKIMKLINNGCKPLDVVNETHLHKSDGSVVVTYDYDPKVIKVIPTKNGYHLITKRFDVMEFNKIMSLQGDVPDIQKKNPTLLYLPNSLHQDQEMEHLKDANFIGGLTMPSEPNEWWSKIDK